MHLHSPPGYWRGRRGNRTPRPRTRALAFRIAFAAGFVAVAGAALIYGLPGGGPDLETAAPEMDAAWRDDERVVTEFARRMEAGIPLDLFGDLEELDAGEDFEVVPVETMLDMLAEEASEDLYDSPEAVDLSVLLDELSELDAQVLEELIQAYESEG